MAAPTLDSFLDCTLRNKNYSWFPFNELPKIELIHLKVIGHLQVCGYSQVWLPSETSIHEKYIEHIYNTMKIHSYLNH
jgi:hypothetical protein